MRKTLLALAISALCVACGGSSDAPAASSVEPTASPTGTPQTTGNNSIAGLPDELAMIEDRAPDARDLPPDEGAADGNQVDAGIVATSSEASGAEVTSCFSSLNETIVDLLLATGDPDAAQQWDDRVDEIEERAADGDLDGAEQIACQVGSDIEAILATLG